MEDFVVKIDAAFARRAYRPKGPVSIRKRGYTVRKSEQHGFDIVSCSGDKEDILEWCPTEQEADKRVMEMYSAESKEAENEQAKKPKKGRSKVLA